MLQKKSNILFKETTYKIAKLIFNYPNKVFHIRLLEKETKLSTTAVISAIKELKDILIIEKTNITTNIKANLDSEDYRFYKRILNLNEIKDLIEYLIDSFGTPETIVLFGSYSRGEDIEKSDIDLLIISKNKPKINLSKFEKDLNRKISLYVFENLNNSSNEFKNSISNGIVLYGYLRLL
ncbi:MAG: nucleotidyltransferase domain-containing protein [Candidatus Woesearchaeota archaeon]